VASQRIPLWGFVVGEKCRELIERLNDWMRCGRGCRSRSPHAQHRSHARRSRRIELRDDIGDKENLGGGALERRRDARITVWRGLRPGRRVEIGTDEARQIAGGSARE
jgi:hypothetical protein